MAIETKQTRYSFTRLDTAEQCAHKYWRRYILGEKGPKTDPLRLGTVVHNTLEAAIGAVIAKKHKGPIDLQKLLRLYASKYVETYTGQGSFEVFKEGEAIVTDWHERAGAVDWEDYESVEGRFDITLDNGVSIMGYIDLIERDKGGTITIVDYKTSRTLPSREDMAKSIQLGIYALAVRKRYPDAKIRLCFDMLRHGVRLYTERTNDELDALERYINTLVDRIGAWAKSEKGYRASLNRFCNWCSFKGKCSAYQGALEVGELGELCPDSLDDIAEERERLARSERLIKARRSDLEAIIKDYIKQQGSAEGCGVRYTLKQTTATKYDAAQTAEVLAGLLGITELEAFGLFASVDKAKVKALIKKNGAKDESGSLIAQAELEAGAKTSYSTRLVAREIDK